VSPWRSSQRFSLVTARTEGLDHVVFVEIRLDQLVHADVSSLVDDGDQVPHPVGVDAEAQPPLRLDLVALGHRDVAHVVAEARDPPALPVCAGTRGPGPAADPVLDRSILPVADDDRPLEPQSRGEETELPIAVSRLVQVHEVHVDFGPGNLAVVLRVKVEERLP
jgi:hypothetical protein